MSFNEQFDLHGAWRRGFATRLKQLAYWLKDHDLLNAAAQERMRRLEAQVRADKVMVAFVAEFSRGKSELINAIFFAGYGRRIMPASAGRTTMCPTELGYDAGIAPCLRLLPIQTRLQPQALAEWRVASEKWLQINLDVNDATQLAQSLQKVAEVMQVSQDEARALGFWHDGHPEDNPPIGPDGRVEVPRWRHALINIDHPLLQQGLVILDTPGLNAIGAEPELTVSLIPQAHAVVFILAADTGVTKSDLAIWREHLVTSVEGRDTRLVVLNKIDTLWDALSTPAEIQTQIERQKSSSADTLGLPVSQVIAVSAQKGLVAKVTGDAVLLEASQLAELESVLAQGVMGQRQKILRALVSNGIGELRRDVGHALQLRLNDFTEQMRELRGLRGKNGSVIKVMRNRVEQEQVEFSAGGAKIYAVRSVHHALLEEVFIILGLPALKADLAELNLSLKSGGIRLNLKKIYGHTFSQLRESLQKAQALTTDIDTMLGSSFRRLNTEFGFSLQVPPAPVMARYVQDLDLIERSHLQYLGFGNLIRLAQSEFSDRLVRALGSRLRVVFEAASADLELWNKSASSHLDVQLRERRRHFSRRIEAIDRIQDAATNLDGRIDEINAQEARLKEMTVKLNYLTADLLDLRQQPQPVDASTANVPSASARLNAPA